MDAGIAGRRYLITGASGGLGSAIARALAAESAAVVLHYHRNRAAAEALAAECGAATEIVQADLREEREADALFDAATRLDGIVVNAGIWTPAHVPLHRMSLAQWEATLRSDLTTTFLSCRGFLRQLAAAPRPEPSIVLVASTAGLFGEAGHADYAAAKAALAHGLCTTLKNEIVALAPRGRVSCVCPGWVDTPMAADALADPSTVATAMATMALRKIATPQDIARAVVFLSSPALAGHVSGAVLPIAGGMEGRLLHPPR